MMRGETRNGSQNPENGYNTYYLRVASRFGIAKWLTLLLFSVYLLCMLFACRESITSENFLYLLRDLNVKTIGGTYQAVQYPEQQNMTFASYRDELAVAGTSSVSLYDRNGEAVWTESIAYRSPQIVAGDKYLLAYDAEGTGYAVCTSLSCIKRGETDDVIQCAAVSDSGYYAIAAQCSEAKYVVCLYDASFTEIARYYRDSYITGMAFSQDGKELAILSVSPDGWNLEGTVILCAVGSTETVSVSLGDSVPLRGRYLENGRLAIVCDDRVSYVDTDSLKVSSYVVQSMTLECFDISSNTVVLCCSRNVLGTSNCILVLDENGNVTAEFTRTEKISMVAASNAQTLAYVVYAGSVEILGLQDTQEALYYGTVLDICETGGYPLLCFSDGAYAIAE